MKQQILMAIGVLGLVATQAQAQAQIPAGHQLSCRGEGQTILLQQASQGSMMLQVVANNQIVKISMDMKASPTAKAYVGRVTEDTALKSKGFTPKGLITLDVVNKRFVVQDPYTGSASVFVSGLECRTDALTGF